MPVINYWVYLDRSFYADVHWVLGKHSVQKDYKTQDLNSNHAGRKLQTGIQLA